MDLPHNKETYIYIDESGTMGLQRNEPYFIICGLILRNDQVKFTKNLVKRITKEISYYRETKELHANEMSFQEKVKTFNHLQSIDFKITYLLIDKNIVSNNFLKKKNIYFNYMIFLMLEKTFKTVDSVKINITIDNRNIKVTAEDSLEEYLSIELIKNETSFKDVYVSYDDSKNNMHLQIVDLFANAIFAKYNYKKTYFYDLISDKIIHAVVYPEKFDNENKLE